LQIFQAPLQSELIFTNGTDGLVPRDCGNRFNPCAESVTITEENIGSNKDSTKIENVEVNVTSTTPDSRFVIVQLDETGVDTGKFKGELFFSDTATNDTLDILKIAPEEFISVTSKTAPFCQSHLLVSPHFQQDDAIEVAYPDIDDEIVDIQATYKTASTTITVGKDCRSGGGGGGGLVRPSLVVNLLAGVSGAGGGDFAAPMLSLRDQIQYSLTDFPLEIEEMVLSYDSSTTLTPQALGLYDNFDYPLTINDKGFVLGAFSNTLETQIIKTNTPTTIKLVFFETTKIQHLSLYLNLRDANSQIHQSDTQILYNDGQPLQIIDPNGFFTDVSVTINDIGESKKQAVLEFTFAKAMDTSHIIVRAWDPNFNSLDTHLLDVIEVISDDGFLLFQKIQVLL